MPRIRRTNRFDRDYANLPARIQDVTEAKLVLLARSPRHPSLRLKRVRSSADVWEISITMEYRATLRFGAEGEIILRRVGPHKLLDRP